MQKYYVDRIEGNIAVCENEEGAFTELGIDVLPKCKEGDCIIYEDGKYIVDKSETASRKERIDNLLDSLFD